MKITYYGHSCFGVEVNGKNLLFDPYISENPLASHININEVKADYILISHGHGDHIGDAIAIAKRTNAMVVAIYEVTEWMSRQGITNVHGMNIGGKARFEFGNIKCVLAVHSSTLPDGTYGGNPMGFVIETSAGCFYFAGDTALTYDMKLIGEYRSVDFAMLPIGDNFTMNADNALIASEFINCDRIIGMHYDTFEPIRIDKTETKLKFERAGIDLFLMDIGQTLTINEILNKR